MSRGFGNAFALRGLKLTKIEKHYGFRFRFLLIGALGGEARGRISMAKRVQLC